MDLYRLLALSENVQACEGRQRPHIKELLNCVYPTIDFSQLSFDKYARRDPKMFFSRTRLNNYFGRFVNDLLKCNCQECRTAKEVDMDIMGISGMKTLLQGHPWIPGFMIYLGKLHFIYYWIKWGFFDSRGVLKNAILDDALVKKDLIQTEPDRLIFQKAYNHAISMFFPMSFQIENNEACPYRYLPESRRFPYSREEPISTKGFYGVMTKVEIVPEYLDRRIVDLVVERYPTSGTDAGSDRKLLFALKSVRIQDSESPLKSMERNVLDMVSRIERPASENMITLFPFDNNKGIVIGLHFDLKPANILITIDGKLKITDFGQSIIQILGKEENMTVPHNPGDSQYAAPESRPTLDYDKDDPKDIEVLLNYDVWSMGCIMVEVLIHMLHLQTLETFDQKLAEEQHIGFFTGSDLKQCVDSFLKDLQEMFRNTHQGHYMVTLSELIRRMLSHDIKKRPFCWEVFDELGRAEKELMDPSTLRDRITPAVKAHNLSDGAGFKELGWDNGQSIVSFADKAGITVELAYQHDGHREEQPKPCRIRLFRGTPRQKQGPLEIALVWGVDQGGKVDVQEKRVELSRWCFSPTYLFRDETNGNGRFECRLFPTMGLPGQRQSFDQVFIFQFESPEDVLLFQGTLFKKAIFPPIRASVETIIPKRPRMLSRERRQPPDFNKKPSHIQLWADDKPKHYKPVGSMNDGHKVFKNGENFPGKHCVNIVNNDATRHESYLVWQLPPQPAWQSQSLSETPHASSSILLGADYQKTPGVENKDSFKVEGMTILLETDDDLNRLRRGTSSEWEED
ncbi:unnamed protein product [Fusarium graminearum]|nr:unnamed protein product [Fusarium graminearum]